VVTYLDSGVLLAAWRSAELRPAALRVLEDTSRKFATSQLTKLELLPKPAFEKRPVERAFYQAHFEEAVATQPLDEQLGSDAQRLAEKYGLAAVDALHLSAALQLGAEEFYTSGKPGRPMFRVKELRVISLHSI
jgi:predicted nucleic acid-binding protein